VVVAGDHGEALGEHGEPTHGTFCYESTLRVPLLIRHPDQHRRGESSGGAVSVADVAPTLIEALALGSCYGLDGVSLHRHELPEGRGVYFESYAGYLEHGWSPLAGRVEAWTKYIGSSSPELYDLATDPSETRNLLPACEGDRARFEEAIAAMAARPGLEGDSPRTVDQELFGELQRMGCVVASPAGALPSPLERLDLPSPADRTAVLQACFEARSRIEAGSYEEAVELLEPVVAAHPRDATALEALASALMELERFSEARDRLQQLLQIDALDSATHVRLAQCLEQLGEPDAALAHVNVAKRLGREFP
jgi:tetratricopeptide (TPR) repeat protein